VRENIYQQFVTTIRKICINNKCGALKDCMKFIMKEISIMECELIMRASDEIVYTALHLK